MSGAFISAFGDADDFQAALGGSGVIGLVITGRGPFRARLTEIALDCLRLTAGYEELSRIADVAVPAGFVLVSFPIAGGAPPIWAGIEMQAGEIVAFGPGERLHARTAGPCRWGIIQVSQRELVQYGRALTGARFVVPPSIARWRPALAAGSRLYRLFRAAIRTAEARPGALADTQAAHGLEQQLLHALVECLMPGSVDEETPAVRRRRNVVAQYEDLLHAGACRRMADICAALGVSQRLLRECCQVQLGMSPSGYRLLRGMQQSHRALRGGNPQTTTVAEVSGRHGFRDLGRFAVNYRAIYGELPSTTLRRDSSHEMAELTLRRPRMKLS